MFEEMTIDYTVDLQADIEQYDWYENQRCNHCGGFTYMNTDAECYFCAESGVN